MILNVEADELALDLPFDSHLVVLDVRREAEYADGHVRQAVNLPLIEMIDPGKIASIDDRDNVYIYCAGGYRSMIAASLLKRQGLHNLRNIVGGWTEIQGQPGIEIVKDNSVLN
jgi:rhodanese-related sulfurtransferase